MRGLFLLICFQSLGLTAQWSEQATGVTDDLFAIQFLGPDTGFCSGADGRLLKTTDGGDHWVGMNVSTNDLHDLYFLDANNGFISTWNTVLSTTNGTDFEQVQAITDGIPESDSLDYNPVSASFSFSGPIGVLFCSYATTPQIAPWITRKWKTLDFGVTWVPMPELPGSIHYAFLDEDHWFAADFNMLESFDGGQTWDTSQTNFFGFPPYCKDCFQILDETGRGMISMAYEMDFGYIPAFDQAMEMIPAVRNVIDMDVQPAAARFLVWSNSGTAVFTSTDYGHTFLPDSTPLAGAQDMDFVSDDLGWACGDSGKIWKFMSGIDAITEYGAVSGPLVLVPNPSTNILHIQAPEHWVPSRSMVMDAAGRTVLDIPYSVALDISGLNPGSYVLIISDTARRQSASFTKL